MFRVGYEFHDWDNVFFRVSPTRRLKRFRKEGKLSPRLVGPNEVHGRIREVAYCH